MPQVEIPAPVFEAATRRAADSGFVSVDDFIVELVKGELDGSIDEPLIRLTEEQLAHVDRAIASIKAGNGMTPEQVDAELAKRRAQWLQNKSHV